MSLADHVTIWPMAQNEETTFVDALCRRVGELRRSRGWTQEQMALALGVPLDRYKKYEVRSPLPMYLIERFATIVGRDIEYIVTGKTTGRRRGPPSLRTGTAG
jgi:transcriptional regulator with XRE-family HTH domain